MKMLSNHYPHASRGDTPGRCPTNPQARSFVAMVSLLLSLCGANAQGTFQSITVTFDGPPLVPPGTARVVQSYDELGVWFAPLPSTDGFTRRGSSPRPYWPENGTAYVMAGLGDSLRFGLDDGLDFGLVSVDLAEWSTDYPEPVTVPFVGYRHDGSTVTASFTTDGIMDGTGPLADFQTFDFPPQFVGVYQVRILTYGWSLDNLVVSYGVPEPGTGTLVGAGTALLRFRLLRGRFVRM